MAKRIPPTQRTEQKQPAKPDTIMNITNKGPRKQRVIPPISKVKAPGGK